MVRCKTCEVFCSICWSFLALFVSSWLALDCEVHKTSNLDQLIAMINWLQWPRSWMSITKLRLLMLCWRACVQGILSLAINACAQENFRKLSILTGDLLGVSILTRLRKTACRSLETILHTSTICPREPQRPDMFLDAHRPCMTDARCGPDSLLHGDTAAVALIRDVQVRSAKV